MIPFGISYVFLLLFFVMFIGPFLLYFFLLFAVKVVELYARYLDWVYEVLGIES